MKEVVLNAEMIQEALDNFCPPAQFRFLNGKPIILSIPLDKVEINRDHVEKSMEIFESSDIKILMPELDALSRGILKLEDASRTAQQLIEYSKPLPNEDFCRNLQYELKDLGFKPEVTLKIRELTAELELGTAIIYPYFEGVDGFDYESDSFFINNPVLGH